MYSVLDFGHMAACGARMDAYARAIARTVKPNSVVLDIGAGTGILSLLAARAGARKVHAVDPNPAIWLLPELAAENGLADRIEIHPISSFDLELAERADVVVSDLRGSLPFHGDHLAVLRDAKTRLLAEGGVLIPARDRLYVALVEAQELAATLTRGVEGFAHYGFRASAVANSIANSPSSDWRVELRANDLLSTAEEWTMVDYGTAAGGAEGNVELATRRCGLARGLAVWFKASIHGDLGFETAPGTSLVYSRYFFPLLRPVALEEGDVARVLLRVDERGERWAWETRILNARGEEKASFRQSTFFGTPTSPDALLRASTSFTPATSAKGHRLRRILDLMDGQRSVEEIAAEVCAADPRLRPETVLDEVRDAVSRYVD